MKLIITLFRFILAFVLMALFFFIPAGSWKWMEAWTLMIIFIIYAIVLLVYLGKNDPQLIEKRSDMKMPKRGWDRLFIISLYLFFAFIIIIPGLDYRFGWSNVPLLLKVVSFVILTLALIGVGFVMAANSWLSRNVEIQKKQKVVSTGPYAIVRHPMYALFFWFDLAFPLALGSWWALIPGILVNIAIVIRTKLEDETLQKELKGYKEYIRKTRYRLFPGVW